MIWEKYKYMLGLCKVIWNRSWTLNNLFNLQKNDEMMDGSDLIIFFNFMCQLLLKVIEEINKDESL